MRLTRGDKAYQAVIYAAVTLLLLAALFPLIYVAAGSFVSETEWNASGGRVVIPRSPSLGAYRNLYWQGRTFFRAFTVSVARTIIGTSLTIYFSMCMGYVLSRRDIPFKTALLVMTLVTILFSGGLIPSFLVVNATGIYDTLWALVIPGLVDSWAVLIFRQFFLNTPESIEESARMDGAGEIVIMWAIVAPLSKAVIAALTLFTAVAHWNAWFDAVVYIRDPALKPFQLLMRDLFINADLSAAMQSEGRSFDLNNRVTPHSVRMAVTVIGTLPILCVYPFLQKYFTEGVYMGAVKE